MQIAFTETRSRASDGQTSRDAGKNAASDKAMGERRWIVHCVNLRPMTAREVSQYSGIDYFTVQRRISECGLVKTGERRDGCAVWAVQ